MLKERITTKMLPIRVLGPACHNRFARERKSILKINEPCNQPRQGRGATSLAGKEPSPIPLEDVPANEGFQLHQLMMHFDHLVHQKYPVIDRIVYGVVLAVVFVV